MKPNEKRVESLASRIAGWIQRNDRQFISSGATQMIQREIAAYEQDAERRGENRVLRLVRSRDHGCNCRGNPGCTCDCHIREAIRARRGKR